MGGDKVFISLKAARGTVVSSKFASVLLKSWRGGASGEYGDAAVRLINILRFFPQLLSPDGRTGKETHRKLIDEVGLVCFALSDIAQSIGGGAIPCSPEIMGVSNLVSEALWSHAHRLKPKAGEALKTARALILQLVVSLPSAPLVGADDKVAALHASPLGSAAVHDGDRAAERRLETESEGHEIDEVLRHDMEILRRTKKASCPGCGRKSALWCRSCLEPLPISPKCSDDEDPRGAIKELLGRALCEVTVHVLLHPKTHRTNTSSLHAALLLPPGRFQLHSAGAGRKPKELEFCSVVEPLPPKFDVSSTVLLFPSPSATPLSSLEPVRADAIKHIVLVEASWQCAQEVVSHPSLQGVPLIKVDMSGARSGAYWKSAPVFKAREGVGEGSTMLSTIEALAICARDVAALKGRESKGVEEGMLFYFRQEVLRRKRAKEHHSLLA